MTYVRLDLHKFRHLREKNRRLKQVVADLPLDKTILRDTFGEYGEPYAESGRDALSTNSLPSERALGVSRACLGRQLPQYQLPQTLIWRFEAPLRVGTGAPGVWAQAVPSNNSTQRVAHESQADAPAQQGGRATRGARFQQDGRCRPDVGGGPAARKTPEGVLVQPRDRVHGARSGRTGGQLRPGGVQWKPQVRVSLATLVCFDCAGKSCA